MACKVEYLVLIELAAGLWLRLEDLLDLKPEFGGNLAIVVTACTASYAVNFPKPQIIPSDEQVRQHSGVALVVMPAYTVLSML